jgi:hypothetical protein
MRVVIVAATYAAALAIGVVLWLWVASSTRVWCPDPHFYVPAPGARFPGLGCVMVRRMPDWVAALTGLTGCTTVLAAGRGVDAFLRRRRHS